MWAVSVLSLSYLDSHRHPCIMCARPVDVRLYKILEKFQMHLFHSLLARRAGLMLSKLSRSFFKTPLSMI